MSQRFNGKVAPTPKRKPKAKNGRRDFDKVEDWSLAELSVVASEPIDLWKRDVVNAEIARRTAQAQIDAARWMKLSVLAIAITSAFTVLFAFLSWMYPHVAQ
jgi:hypothetical protein